MTATMALPIQMKMKGKALVYDILKDIISASQAEKNVLDIYSSKFSHSSIMDFHLGSEFSISLDQNLQDRVLHEIFDEIDDYITDEIHNYLTDFFNTDRRHQGWCEVARSIAICE
ncbi:8823_t:CDS:2 [Funneliformis geosporum]|nr:8823_t:CDS:2 [Funneliformis geosporum]